MWNRRLQRGASLRLDYASALVRRANDISFMQEQEIMKNQSRMLMAILAVVMLLAGQRAMAWTTGVRWSRLSEQYFRVDKWSLCLS